jgi:subtilisin family serine protease
MEVASILVACCDAQIHLYNVWSETGLDRLKLYEALADVAERGRRKETRVLNMSLGTPIEDAELAAGIRACVEAGVIVAAAMGDGYKQRLFPAALYPVIAVGAVDPHDRPIKDTNSGWHAFIAAPGEGIRVIQDDDSYRRQDGTSYSTPMVSAAVWLALRHRPDFEQQQMSELLKGCVRKPREAGDENFVGFGILDLHLLSTRVP